MAKRKKKSPDQEAIEKIKEGLEELKAGSQSLTAHGLRRVRTSLVDLVEDIGGIRASLDPILMPERSFDPSDPGAAGRLVAIALLAQPRVPLARLARTYGSGVYAIYYQGDHPAYTRLSGTETPLYVGKADPPAGAMDPMAQGDKLWKRLDEHLKQIAKNERRQSTPEVPNDHPLRVSDFTCRRLVCSTNAQLFAERHLIDVFQPIWNSDIRVAWGISKHGDSREKRDHPPSPFDVMHPGRVWPIDWQSGNPAEIAKIFRLIDAHLDEHPPYSSRDEAIEHLIADFGQTPPLLDAGEEIEVDDDAEDEDEAPNP